MELFVRVFSIQEFVLPAPSVIFKAMWQWRQADRDQCLADIDDNADRVCIRDPDRVPRWYRTGSSQIAYDGFYPALIAFNSVPKVAVVPVLVIWFGIGTVPAVITAFLLAFFPILVNVATGIATVDPSSVTCCVHSAQARSR